MAFALIPETGAGLADANSYASLAEFADYAGGHLYASAHTGASDLQRSQALVMATRALDARMAWNGQRASTQQRLEWPRGYAVRPPALDGQIEPSPLYGGYGESYWPSDELPRPLIEAVCEFALDLLTQDRSADADSVGIRRLGLGQGAVEIEFDPADRRRPLPAMTEQLILPLGRPRAGGAMARVSRTY